jgi:hypothetical protein
MEGFEMQFVPKQVFILDSDQLDGLVEQTYGKPYCFQQQDGCKNRGSLERFILPIEHSYDFKYTEIPEKVNGDVMGVSFEAWLARDISQKLNSDDPWDREHGLSLFWNRNFYPHPEMIMSDLNKRGILPDGDYVINIDW